MTLKEQLKGRRIYFILEFSDSNSWLVGFTVFKHAIRQKGYGMKAWQREAIVFNQQRSQEGKGPETRMLHVS